MAVIHMYNYAELRTLSNYMYWFNNVKDYDLLDYLTSFKILQKCT